MADNKWHSDGSRSITLDSDEVLARERSVYFEQRQIPHSGGIGVRRMRIMRRVFAVRPAPASYEQAIGERLLRIRCLEEMYQSRRVRMLLEHGLVAGNLEEAAVENLRGEPTTGYQDSHRITAQPSAATGRQLPESTTAANAMDNLSGRSAMVAPTMSATDSARATLPSSLPRREEVLAIDQALKARKLLQSLF